MATNPRKPREKRCHHPNVPHMRPAHRPADKQRKLREKRRNVDLMGTDNTTSGDDGDETKNESERDCANKLEQLLRRPNQLNSDLEADIEDNNSTDVDQVSISGSINNADKEAAQQTATPKDLSAKVAALEKQLATVLQLNSKLVEENKQLRKVAAVTNQK
ncbi:hypothetical protein M3Y99_00471000 [Aphelenchoides fujianensis]|nr:hypothetical protein M3Y99_00471000 [Aphelenchoides fujianensis]